MDSPPFGHLFFTFMWIFVFFLHSVRSQVDAPTVSLDHRVFVTLTGEDLPITVYLKKPANQSRDTLMCSDPFNKQIYNQSIPSTTAQQSTHKLRVWLRNLTISGEYYCKYQKVKVYWFLRVRATSYEEIVARDYTEIIIVHVLTGVLLVFSVVGSVYIFWGHWRISKCGKTGQKKKQNKEEGKRTEIEDGNAYVTAPSAAVYASLEPRTRSIYGELDCSAASKKPDQQKAKPKKKEANQTKLQTTQDRDEGQFESVYENY